MNRRGRGVRADDFDESDVRVRPNKRGSRPRTKDRPAHRDAVTGRVVTVDRGRYTVALGTGDVPDWPEGGMRPVTAMRARELRRTPVVTGDLVGLVGDLSGTEGTLARIVRIEERTTVLRRSADDSDEVERVVVANVDILVIMVAAANPEPRTGFIDRALVAAYDAGIHPVLCITKTDLREPTELVEHYRALDLEVLTSQAADVPVSSAPGSAPESAPESAPDSSSAPSPEPAPDPPLDPAPLGALRARLEGHITAMVGPSGVGKSTLINALTGADRATGHVNVVTGRGRHTSSSTLALPMPDAAGGAREASWVIDTPGIRSFGLGLVDPDRVIEAFDDLGPALAGCPKGCTHAAGEPGCALDAWVTEGHAGPAGPERLASLRRLLAGRVAGPGAADAPVDDAGGPHPADGR